MRDEPGIGEDELLDKFESRMENELSLNATQTAHARQILSDLMDTLEPQQPEEGELVNYCAIVCHATLDNDASCPWSGEQGDRCDKVAEAQLAHDKATMVKLPSEDELALWLCDHLSYTSRGLAQELLLRLLGGKP